MIKSKIEKQLERQLNGKLFVSPNRLRVITGFGSGRVANILQGLDFLEDDKGKKYFVSDVAEKIADMKTR